MNKIKSIACHRFSSKYGESNNSFGQPLGVKTIVLISLKTTSGKSRSHELYAGIYCPEILPTLVSKISEIYIGREIKLDYILRGNEFPFIANSGIIKSIVGAIESCIMQLYFEQNGIPLVDGLKTLLNSPKRDKGMESEIKYYGSGGSVAYSPSDCLKDAKKVIEKDLDGFKMRCGLQELDNDIERVKIVHKYIKENSKNKNVSLMIDFIQGTLNPKLGSKQLSNYINALEKFNIFWFEEPLDPDNIELYEELFDLKNFNKLCLGESFTCLNEFVAFKNLINFFQLDVTHLGGFSETIKVLNYMHKFNPKIRFSSHVWGSALSGLLNLALCRASNLISWFEIPLLNFEINLHLFNQYEINYSEITNDQIDLYLKNINTKKNNNYEFIKNSGYTIKD